MPLIALMTRHSGLSCPAFVTTAELLSQHHRHFTQTRALDQPQPEQRGQQRLAKMIRAAGKNLIAIVGGLTAPGGCPGACACTPSSPAAPEASHGR